MKENCGNVGIDCEWCDNKEKCLNISSLKLFYKTAQGTTIHEDIDKYWEMIVKEMTDKFSNQIIIKTFTVSKLPNDPISENYIKITIKYCVREKYPFITKHLTPDNKLIDVVEMADRPDDLFSRVKNNIKNKFGLDKVYLYSRYNEYLEPKQFRFADKTNNEYNLYFRV